MVSYSPHAELLKCAFLCRSLSLTKTVFRKAEAWTKVDAFITLPRVETISGWAPYGNATSDRFHARVKPNIFENVTFN